MCRWVAVLPASSRMIGISCLLLVGLWGCSSQQPVEQLWPQSSSPVHQATPAPAQSVTDQLLGEARQLHQAGRWPSLISTAEQGLRIDRREPQWYWYLASSYLQLGDRAQAASFARQGLRYAQSGSLLESRLEALLRQADTPILN